MGKYEQDARLLLEYVGGKENIAAVSHCVSRMRFVLNDPAKADVAKIESLKSAKGTFTQAGQFQVIIGNTVNDFYNDFIAVSGIDGVSKDAVKSAAKQNQNALQRIMSVLAEIFAPLIPAIITGGLILGFRNCIDSIYLFGNGTQTLCDISQFWSGVDSFLWLIGEAIFHMLPVCICWSVTKKMGTTQSLGIVLGLTLVSGQLLNAYAVASTAAADIPKWDFGFFTINMIGYQAQVIPAMLAAFTLVYLERFFRKICPPVISMIVVPFCSLVLSVIIAHTVLGPIGWKIGSVISDVVYAGISGSFRVVFGAIFGFVYAPLVITGLHHMSNAIDMQLIADFGGTMLWPMIALSNIAQGSAVLGMIYPHFTEIDQYRDVESLNYYKILREQGKSEAETLNILAQRSRDDGRTPMQWDSSPNAGFTSGTPWIGVADNYKSINAAAQTSDADSIYSFYKAMVRLRKEHRVISEGKIEFLYPDNTDLLAYRRYGSADKEELLVLCNLTEQEIHAELPDAWTTAEKLIGNYADNPSETLRPYECVVLHTTKE